MVAKGTKTRQPICPFRKSGMAQQIVGAATTGGLVTRSLPQVQQRRHNSVTLHASTGRCTRRGGQRSARQYEEGDQMMFRRLFYTLILTAFLASVMVTGCAPVTVQQTTLKQTYTDVRADVLTTGELSQMKQQVLRMQGLQAEAQDPARAFQDLEARSTRASDDDQQVALTELALWNAMRTESSDPTTAVDWYVLAA